MTLPAPTSGLGRDTPWLQVLSSRTSLSALMPSPAFPLASGPGLARIGASHLLTACSPLRKPRRPQWPPRSAGLSPPPTTDWTSPLRRTTLLRLLTLLVTQQPCCPMQLLESRHCHCPPPAALIELLVITLTRRDGAHAHRPNTAVNQVLYCHAGHQTPWARERPLPTTWWDWRRGTL